MKVAGNFTERLSVAGRLSLDRTEIRVPSTGVGAFDAVYEITHEGEPFESYRTREKAGLLNTGNPTGNANGPIIELDVQIDAENRIFVRGRGLDAELGGRLRLSGTATNVIPQGQFSLIRGRLDILGKRLELVEGSARLQGVLIPTLRMVARTSSDGIILFVFVEGAADAPEIKFVSEPQLPSDEVVSRLMFGRGAANLSPIQMVQLASAVATLAGRGGTGIVERLRQTTGFDDLDLTSDLEGGTSVRAGKYISENVYTDVVLDSDGQTRINLNLDLSATTKLRGEAGSDGSTGIGLFFEKDY